MKFSKTLIVLGLIAVLLTACGALPQVAAVGGSSSSPDRNITVNGTGTVTMSPDKATIWIGVSTQDASASDALAQNNAQTEQVMDTLREFGLEDDDLQTAYFSIWPNTNYDFEGQPTGTVYQVQNTVLATIRDLDRLGALLDAVVQSGANTISNIQFDVEDTTQAYDQALQAAMQNADERAILVAETGELTLGQVLTIQTFIGGGGIVQPFGDGAAQGLGGGGGGAVPVYDGKLEITVQVTVSYEIR
jgi:hypothetical protein